MILGCSRRFGSLTDVRCVEKIACSGGGLESLETTSEIFLDAFCIQMIQIFILVSDFCTLGSQVSVTGI